MVATALADIFSFARNEYEGALTGKVAEYYLDLSHISKKKLTNLSPAEMPMCHFSPMSQIAYEGLDGAAIAPSC